MRKVALGEVLIATVGLAIRRHCMSAPDEKIRARIADLRKLLMLMDRNQRTGQSVVREIREQASYADWAPSYDDVDDEGDHGFEHEQPVVRALLDTLPVGRVLDAACGTGRHLTHLLELGHAVAGFDRSPEMLAMAKAKAPDADLRVAALEEIPWEDGAFDSVLCGLAMEHQPAVAVPVRELARVTRRGGRVIISDQHPMHKFLGHQAMYIAKDGAFGFIPSYMHLHSEYLRAFADAGLQVRQCLEPVVGPRDSIVATKMYDSIREAAAMAYLGLPMVLVWDLERL
jgi:SAM-dependent methyltransferase